MQEVCRMAEVLGFRVWVGGGQVDRDSFVTLVYFAYPNRSDRLRLRVGARVRRSTQDRPCPQDRPPHTQLPHHDHERGGGRSMTDASGARRIATQK